MGVCVCVCVCLCILFFFVGGGGIKNIWPGLTIFYQVKEKRTSVAASVRAGELNLTVKKIEDLFFLNSY